MLPHRHLSSFLAAWIPFAQTSQEMARLTGAAKRTYEAKRVRHVILGNGTAPLL